MGCRLSGLWVDDGTGRQDLSQISQRDAMRILGRWYCSHATQPLDHRTVNHYLPSIPLDMDNMDRLQDSDPEMSSSVSKRQRCFIGCCNSSMEEPNNFLNQTEDEEPVLEKPLGYFPLMHELDSGLGCTDGSFHQGELSAAETEEGLEEPVSSPPDRTSRGSSPSSESLISSELSDSGFYSVSTGEFRRFQRLLEKRIRLYRARMASRDQREGHKACWDLESIPETLACQSQSSCNPETNPACTAHQCTMGSSSVQFRKASNAHVSKYCTSGNFAQANKPHSTTSSCQQRISLPRQSSSAEYLWRSNTLHRPGPSALERRRASHPTSPNYHEATVQCCRQFSTGFHGREDLAPVVGYCGGSPWQQETMFDYQSIVPTEHYINGDYNLSDGRIQDNPFYEEHQRPRSESEWPQRHFLTLEPSQDVHDTWPKSANRCGSKKGIYGTMDAQSPNTRRVVSGNSRAMRNQLLKARASQLADERSEVTTDEEAHSEVRTGRYWTKTERRQHLLLAREQRLQRMARAGSRISGEGGWGGFATDTGGCNAVLELSHRKLSRMRNRNLLDDWTTMEELLTHGYRGGSSEAILCPSPLLSVTTV